MKNIDYFVNGKNPSAFKISIDFRVSSGFGHRKHPISKWKKHNGVDYGCALGTPIMSCKWYNICFKKRRVW